MRASALSLLVVSLLCSAITVSLDLDDFAILRRVEPIVVHPDPPSTPKTGPNEPSTEPNTGNPSGGTSGGSSGGTSGGRPGNSPSDGPSFTTGGTYKPPEVVNPDGYLGGGPPNDGVEGTAPTSNSNFCSAEAESCLEIIENAIDIIKEVVENAMSSSSTTTTTTTATSYPSDNPIMSTSISASPKSSPTGGPIPNANMSSWMDLRYYHEQLTPDEFNMLKSSPVCFFANMEALYQGYADQMNSSTTLPAATSSTPSSATATTATSAALFRRMPQNASPCTAGYDVFGQNSCVSSSTSLSSSSSAATALYASYLPSQISMVYLSTPTSLRVTATSTTTCSGLGSSRTTAFQTTYALFGYKEGFGPSGGAAATAESGGNAPTTGAAPGNGGNLAFLRGFLIASAVLGWVTHVDIAW